MFCVPTHLQRLFAHWSEFGVPDLSAFRLVAHAGAACPPKVKERMVELFPDGSTWEFYGSTEDSSPPAAAGVGRPPRHGWSGRPGAQAAADDRGTIWSTVPSHARFTYWNAPAKTEAAWRETEHGPAFTVGDLGRLDDDGYLFLDERRGVNVYPVEVENTLRKHPGLTDVAVFVVPDERWGQRVCAAVVGDVDPAGLRELAKARLSPAKRSKEYYALEALPVTATGKVRRLDLPGLLGLE